MLTLDARVCSAKTEEVGDGGELARSAAAGVKAVGVVEAGAFFAAVEDEITAVAVDAITADDDVVVRRTCGVSSSSSSPPGPGSLPSPSPRVVKLTCKI